jgi:hypothetical protein
VQELEIDDKRTCSEQDTYHVRRARIDLQRELLLAIAEFDWYAIRAVEFMNISQQKHHRERVGTDE